MQFLQTKRVSIFEGAFHLCRSAILLACACFADFLCCFNFLFVIVVLTVVVDLAELNSLQNKCKNQLADRLSYQIVNKATYEVTIQ